MLKESVDYIRRLQRNEQQLRNANMSLQKRVLELEHMLRQQLTSGGLQSALHETETDEPTLLGIATDSSFAFLTNVVKDEPSESASTNGLSDALESSSESAVLNGDADD